MNRLTSTSMKRMISLLLSVAMLFSLLPASVSAAQNYRGTKLCSSCYGDGTITYDSVCYTCNGSGRARYCATCGSTNIITIVDGIIGAYTGCASCSSPHIVSGNCRSCGGRGSYETTITCTDCHGTGYAHYHEWSSSEVSPTCTEVGYTEKTCSCGEYRKDYYTTALGHDYVDGSCSRCGSLLEDAEEFRLANELSDGDRIIIYSPTSDVAISSEVLRSDYKAGVGAEPKDGVIYTDISDIIWTVKEAKGGYYLIDCNGDYLATFSSNGLHTDGDYRIWNTSEASTKECVYLSNNCGRYLMFAGESLYFEVVSNDYNVSSLHMQIYSAQATCSHDYETVVTPADCTQEGYTTYTCNLCDKSYADDHVEALGHAWDEGTVTSYPGIFSDGEMFYCCTRCDETKTEIIPADTHSYSTEVIPPTCTQEGYTIYSCDWCRSEYYDDYVDALGHAWDKGTVTISPTFTKDGEKTYSCTRCDEIKTEIIPATGADYKPCNGGAGCPSAKFKDIKKSHWFHESVDFAVTYGLFSGTSSTTFSPNANMTRAMLVTVLWRYAGQPKGGKNTFTDVKNGQWYTDAVTWAAKNGVVTGVGNNKFNPNGNVTREQLATILYRYAIANEIDVRYRAEMSLFSDYNKVSSYADKAVYWAVAVKLINGADGKLMPQGKATRAQVAAILTRFVQNVAG